MDISASSAIANTYTGYQQQPHHKLASRIVQATVAIKYAQKHLQESIIDNENNKLIKQVIQSSALLPMLFTQHLQMIETLEQKFGMRFASNCRVEIEEIANVAERIQASMESLKTIANCVDVAEQNDFAKSIFESTARLNILQQRIAGKMMKVK
jgi:enoyl-[acyl-carrier-protein] reductase (NADH)